MILLAEKLQRGLLLANSTHVCNMDIRHITALKDEMFCHAANLSGILFMAVDIANQWLFYVDSDNHVLMQYSMIFNATTVITDAGPNVTGELITTGADPEIFQRGVEEEKIERKMFVDTCINACTYKN